jgi:hypothetical protein
LTWAYCPACQALSRDAKACRWCDGPIRPATDADIVWRSKGAKRLMRGGDVRMIFTLTKDGRHHDR